VPLDAARNLNAPRPYRDLKVDDALTDLPPPGSEGMRRIGRVELAGTTLTLEVLASPPFRETVVFTPPHRQAFCIEPYTCITDALNLQQRGVEAGLLVLGPGESWSGIVEMRLATR
jgi:aldose 1-epimerase